MIFSASNLVWFLITYSGENLGCPRSRVYVAKHQKVGVRSAQPQTSSENIFCKGRLEGDVNTYYGGLGGGRWDWVSRDWLVWEPSRKTIRSVPILQTWPIDKSNIVNCFGPFIHELKILRAEIYKRLTFICNLCNWNASWGPDASLLAIPRGLSSKLKLHPN